MFHTLNKNEQEHETLKYTRETIKSLLFDDEFKVLTCHSQLGALSEYHSDSVCTHGRTKTSWLSLMRGVELKHPVETNFHCPRLIHFISLLIFTDTAGLYSNTLVSLEDFISCASMFCSSFYDLKCLIVFRVDRSCHECLSEVFVTV